jgi:deoxyxylulose-5-phosphate synthase
MVGDAASAKDFGDRLLAAPRSFADRTSISGGIEFAMTRRGQAPFNSARHTIDISGDGTNNAGRDVAETRDDAVAKGVTINGLVILSDNPMSWNPEHTNPPGGLDNYYRNKVVGGEGAFVMVAKDFNSFGQAMIGKLIAEVAENSLPKERRYSAR